MIFKEEMKYFSAVTYNNETYTFAVTPEGDIYCYEFDIATPTNIIELKPNFILRDEKGKTLYSLDDYYREKNIKKSLISEWKIDDELFEQLIQSKKIMYSTHMALLYGFDPIHAYDSCYQKRAFKSYRNNPDKKTKILSKQKSGP